MKTLSLLTAVVIPASRKKELDTIAQELKKLLASEGHLNMNFVCTHNSRRSQFSQFWSFVIAKELNLPISSFSSGTEVTACNERTIASLNRQGFEFDITANGTNPIYQLRDNDLQLFSKTVDDQSQLPSRFVALMTCDHADANCPFIPEAIARIPFRFEDPKVSDDTELEAETYDNRSAEIGAQILYIYQQL